MLLIYQHYFKKKTNEKGTYIHTYILIVFWDKSTIITKNTNYNKKYKKTEVISICLFCLFSCCVVVLFVLFLLLPLLLLFQYKRLHAQSKK